MIEELGLLQYVNPLQGTDSHHGFSTGNTLPLVAMPFGMNHWSAQTSDRSNWYFSPRDHTLQGIRCTHQPSPWISDYGHFTVMANSGWDTHLSAHQRARSYIGEFHPHRFKATLQNDGTTIEMTPSERGAIFRFTFGSPSGRVIIDPPRGHAEYQVLDSQTVVGWVNGNSGGVVEDFAHYFVARFDREALNFSGFQDGKPIDGASGERVGFFGEFDDEVTMRIATSFISIEQAARNLELELTGTFDEICGRARDAWEATMQRIVVETDDEDARRTFYSCLYRTQLFPRIWHEETPTGRQHRSPYDGQVHDGPLYTDNGFWDTYRTVYPLFALLQPDRLAEILEGWVNAYKEGGWFPQWASPGYRACMVGTHIDAVIADGVARGVTGFDVKSAIEGMLKHADEVGDPDGAWGRVGIEDYQDLGFVSNKFHESVARSLDYAYDDWCISQVTGRKTERTQNYQHLYDSEVGFMRAKNPDGTWQEPWEEFHWGSPYVEGGPWQSSWAVQHDAAGLIRLMGGDAAFSEKLDRLLELPPYFTVGAYGFEIHEMTEMAMGGFGQYAHSNQPVHHVLYLYNSAGRPWRTQKEVRAVMAKMYSPTHLPGDEDNGEMCAWYVLSALGIFPLTPGHPSWTLGSPLFRRSTVHLPSGKKFVVEAPANSSEAVYASTVSLDDRRLDRLFLTHAEVAEGGTLRFAMSTSPSSGIIPAAGRPYSESEYEAS